MAYNYRKVKCPWCGHVFMWNKDEQERLITCIYQIKESRKHVKKTKCPKCEKEMLVLGGVFEGIDLNDNRVECIGVRGI